MHTDLRRARWWDIPAMAVIEADLFALDAWSVETFWSELAGVPATRWYVVAIDAAGEVAGYVGLAAAQGSGDVQTLAVRRDQHGRGLGTVLLDALLAEAARRDCAEILLEVRADNPAARALYASRGFVEIARRPRYYGDGGDALILRRS